MTDSRSSLLVWLAVQLPQLGGERLRTTIPYTKGITAGSTCLSGVWGTALAQYLTGTNTAGFVTCQVFYRSHDGHMTKAL